MEGVDGRATMLAPRTIERAVTDRGAAFSALTDRHLDGAYRLAAVILGDALEAEDAVHDAAVAAWRSFGQLRDPAAFEAWFSRIVVNTCRDRLRSRRRRPVVDVAAELLVAEGPRAPDALAPLADRDALARAFAVLDPDETVVVVLRYWRDLTVDDIAARLGIPPGTVKSRLHHALGRLRTALHAAEVSR
jgi:RNA polymerase sigma factor (sigma-70 family)